jgi:hypothetical protein
MQAKRLLMCAALFGISITATVALAQNVVFQPVVKAAGPVEVKAAATKSESQVDLDKKTLQAVDLKDDDYPKLIAYLKDRTLTGDSLANIQALIKKFEWNVPFEERIAAQDQLIKIGGPAVAPLKLAIKDDKEAEVTFRSKETLKRMEKEKSISGDVTSAVVRALGKSKSPEAVEALFGFLPLADTAQLIDLIQQSVIANAGEPGKPNPLLVKALDDTNDNRRRIAAIALASGGTEKERIRFKEVHPKLIEMAKVDKDNSLRFELSRILLLECREKQAVGFLIETLPGATRGQSWVVEELLVQIAGKDAPKERCKHTKTQGETKEPSSNKTAREKVRDAWKKWWTTNADKIDLNKLNLKQTLRGEFVMMIQSWNGRQQIQVYEYARDDSIKNRYAFENNSGFMDIYLDGDRTLMMDGNSFNLVERDGSGKTIASRTVPDNKKGNGRNFGFQGKTLQLLPNGNILVVTGNGFVEMDKDFKEVSRYTRPDINNQPQFDVSGAYRMNDGKTAVLLTTNRLFLLDDKLKEDKERKSVTTQPPAYRQNLAQSGEDKVLVLEQSQLTEYDLKTGKASGEAKVKEIYNAICLQRLPNGNIMYVDQNNYPNSIVEKSATGEVVYSVPIPDNNGNLVKGMVK